MFKKRITRLVISIISYFLLVGTYWLYPTIKIGNNIFKNIAILLVGQPFLFLFTVGFAIAFIAFFVLLMIAVVSLIFEWIMEGEK